MTQRRSEEHINRVTDPRFSKNMEKTFPLLRGFKQKLRQGKEPIKPAPFEAVEAKREERKEKRKKAKLKEAEIKQATKHNKRRIYKWWG